jgi:trigger factor
LNEDFAKAFGRETVEELKEALRKDIASYKHSQSVEKMKAELFEKLLALCSFPFPESLVEKQKERLISDAQQRYRQMGARAEDLEKEAARIESEASARAKDQIRLYFILQRIAELEKIDLDELELTQKLQAMAAQSKRPLEEVRRVFEDDLRESLREKKTIDFLIANAKFEEDKK